ncbi:MAG: hypothetical protein AAFV09_07810 [Pseudomonadota bacterium]
MRTLSRLAVFLNTLFVAVAVSTSGASAALVVEDAEPRLDVSGIEVAQAILVPVPRPGGTSTPAPEPVTTPNAAPDPAPVAEVATQGTPDPDAVRPRARPAAASPAAPAAEAVVEAPEPVVDGERVTVSLPKPRPSNLATRAAAIQEASARAREARANAASIANRQINSASTQSGILDVTQISLIGVFGTPQSRRALLRLSTGDFVRVSQGGSVNGWQVIAISPSSIRLSRGGEVQVLDLPS